MFVCLVLSLAILSFQRSIGRYFGMPEGSMNVVAAKKEIDEILFANLGTRVEGSLKVIKAHSRAGSGAHGDRTIWVQIAGDRPEMTIFLNAVLKSAGDARRRCELKKLSRHDQIGVGRCPEWWQPSSESASYRLECHSTIIISASDAGGVIYIQCLTR